MPELLVTVAIIGLLSAIAVPLITDAIRGTRHAATEDVVAFLNRATAHYSQIEGSIAINAGPSTADEIEVIELLQTRNASIPGSPFIPAEFSVQPTNDTSQPRIIWDGTQFRLLQVNLEGTGLLVAP